MAKKLAFLVADGMGGWPLETLGGKTTLEAAATPNMDRLAGQGVIGLCQSVPAGMPPGSDVANMSLLGFNPAEHHTGRLTPLPRPQGRPKRDVEGPDQA